MDHKKSAYHRKIATNHQGYSDVYDVLQAFEVTNPATAHAVKKLLVPGRRSGGKTEIEDLSEAKWSIARAMELLEQPAPEMKALDWFFGMMKDRMATSGKSGWDDHDDCPTEDLIDFFIHNLVQGAPTALADAANFLMMIAYRGDGAALAERMSDDHGSGLTRNAVYITDEEGHPLYHCKLPEPSPMGGQINIPLAPSKAEHFGD